MSDIDDVETIPFWKKIYQTVSQYSDSVTNDIVEEIFNLSKDDLVKGYALYKPYCSQNFEKWRVKMKNFQPHVHAFFNRLCRNLNLSADIGFPIFFNYLMFEYYGKIEEVSVLTKYEHNTMPLIENVLQFYSSERMFYIKTLRHVFEHMNNDKHSFSNEFSEFVQRLDMKSFRKSLMSQLRNIISEITEKNIENAADPKAWVARNNREQLEFVLLLTTTAEYKPFDAQEFEELVRIFLIHNFTRQPVYFDSTLMIDEQDLFDVKCAEIGLFIVGINQIKSSILTIPDTIENSLKDIQTQGNHAVILFAWTFSKLKYDKNADEATLKKYDFIIKVLLERNLFYSVQNFVSSDIFKITMKATKLILKSSFDLLNEFMISFEQKQLLIYNVGLILTVEEYLKYEDLAQICLQKQGGFDALVKMAFDVFPFDFCILTRYATALVQHEAYLPEIISQLKCLTTFAEARELRVSDSNTSILPQVDSDETLDEDSMRLSAGLAIHESFLQVSREYSYFQYVEQILSYVLREGDYQYAEQIPKIVSAFELICEIVKSGCDLSEIGHERSVLLLHALLVRIEDCATKYADVVRVYFKYHAYMVLYQHSDVCKEFQFYAHGKSFLPNLHLSSSTPESLFQRDIIDSLLFQYLRSEERSAQHDVLLLYLKLLRRFIGAPNYVREVQMPGVMYIANFVFPFHLTWEYSRQYERCKITMLCLEIFHSILHNMETDIATSTLRKFVVINLINNGQTVETFLQLMLKEKFYLQVKMQREVDWDNGHTLDEIAQSKIQLGILLNLMSDSQIAQGYCLKSRLPTVAKCVASLITNAYSATLANLACRFLERLSRDQDIPILALLEMDYSQIQCLFLDRLRDPLEDDALKITVLEFIDTSLKSQNGLTAAFFNAPDMPSKKGANVPQGDSVCDFMIDYLQNIKKSHEYLANPVQKNILKVFATLWQTGRESLVKDIYSLKLFWPLLADPMFHDFNKEPEAYSHILTIITIHIGDNVKQIDKHLIEVIESFFQNKKLLRKWIKYVNDICGSFKDGTSNEETTTFLYTWQNFLVIIKNCIPSAFNSNEIKCDLIKSCMQAIQSHFCALSDNKVITIFSDLYLVLIFAWPDAYKDNYEVLDVMNTVLLKYVSRSGASTLRNREVFLTMVHKTLIEMKDALEENPKALTKMLEFVGIMIEKEYFELQRKHENVSNKVRAFMCWILVARLGDSILSLKTVKPHQLFFTYQKYLNKMVESLQILLSDTHTLPMAKMVMETLIKYAESDIAKDFLTENILVIYEVVYPFTLGVCKKDNLLQLHIREQWVLYRLLIKLNHILLSKFGERMLEANFTFLTVHGKIFSEILCLPEYTVDDNALDLVSEALYYVHSVLQWVSVWSAKYTHSFSIIMGAIKRMINASISTLLRPENVIFYDIDKLGTLTRMDEVPDKMIVGVMDKYMELTALGARCLVRCNPSVTDFLGSEKPSAPLFRFVEHDFSVPKFDVRITDELTYGRLLCIVHFLCRALTMKPESTETLPKSPSKPLPTKETRSKTLTEIFEQFTISSQGYIGFIEFPEDFQLNKGPKLSTYLTFGYSGTTSKLNGINRSKIQLALEYLMTFMATQVFFHVNTLQKPALQYFKREMYSELQFFNEYVKKVTTEEFNKLRATPFDFHVKADIDFFNKFMVAKKSICKDKWLDDSDKIFLLVISKWFSNICELS